jgi:phenylalanine-4-hydroxylase
MKACSVVSAVLARSIKRSRSFHSASASWSNPRVAILTEIADIPGSLHEMLKFFWKHDVDLTRIESRPTKMDDKAFQLYIDFAGRIEDENVQKLMTELRTTCSNMLILDDREVDKVANKTLDAGADLVSDHPGFSDPTYRKRRMELATIAQSYACGDRIPTIEYKPEEIETWGVVYSKLKSLQGKYACSEYLEIIAKMEQEVGYSRANIPQAQDISEFLQSKTGFKLRPVAGLLSARDFLNGLAFRTFFSTQYIR